MKRIIQICLEDVKQINSCLINAGGAGYGKSVLLLMLFDNDNDVICK